VTALPADLWIVVALAAGLAVFLVRESQIAGTVGAAFPLDDSWIHLHFARNLAEGHGFVYNPGDPVAGSTAPLWTLLLAGAFAVLGSDPVWAKALGALAALATALATRRLALAWSGDSALGLVAGLLTALAGPMLWGALSGMEVALAALLVTGGVLAVSSGRPWTAAVLLGLATLARPECLLLLPALWLAGPPTAARATLLGAVVAAIVAPWVAFNLATAGTPLPATASAKIEGGLVGYLAGQPEPIVTALLTRPWQFALEWVTWLGSINVLLPALAPLGLWALWRRRGRVAVVPALMLVVHPLGMALLAPYRGPAFQEGRYSIHLLPLAVTVAAMALTLLPRAFASRQERRVRMVAAVVLGVAMLAPLWPAATRYGWAIQNIEAMQVHLGRWVARETPPNARIALNDVGAIAFLSRREVVDVMGLVTPAIVPYRREAKRAGRASADAGVLSYLERVCPDYLIIFPEWFRELSADTRRFRPVDRVKLDHNTVAGADEMVVYETVWNRWRPDRQPCGNGAAGTR
jgi:hypothetical protein